MSFSLGSISVIKKKIKVNLCPQGASGSQSVVDGPLAGVSQTLTGGKRSTLLSQQHKDVICLYIVLILALVSESSAGNTQGRNTQRWCASQPRMYSTENQR